MISTETQKAENDFIKKAFSYRERLYDIARLKLGNSFDAEDAVNETFIKAASKHSQLKDQSKLYSWLMKILVNQCNDMMRSQKPETSIESSEALGEDRHLTSDPAGRMELINQIESILDMMLNIEPPELGEILILYYYRKLSYNELSVELSIPIGTVKSRLSKAREILQHKMKKEGFSSEDLETIRDLYRWPEICLL